MSSFHHHLVLFVQHHLFPIENRKDVTFGVACKKIQEERALLFVWDEWGEVQVFFNAKMASLYSSLDFWLDYSKQSSVCSSGKEQIFR